MQRFGTTNRGFTVIVSCFSLLHGLSLPSQAQLPNADNDYTLERVLREARARRREYMDAFRNLTAEEIKVTEIFDKAGNVERRRRLVATFFVYQSQIEDSALYECHVIREVDGKAISDYKERAERLFAGMSDERTRKSEWQQLHRENTRYKLKYERWGVTLYMVQYVGEEAASKYDYAIVGRERRGGREMIVLGYSRKSAGQRGETVVGTDRKRAYLGDRGRVWLDAETFRVRRWENEQLMRHKETGEDLVYLRDEVDYVESELGITVPRRIVVSYFDRVSYRQKSGERPRSLLGGRITFDYGSFKRFNVTSREELRSVERN